jgi:hypothetical protein
MHTDASRCASPCFAVRGRLVARGGGLETGGKGQQETAKGLTAAGRAGGFTKCRRLGQQETPKGLRGLAAAFFLWVLRQPPQVKRGPAAAGGGVLRYVGGPTPAEKVFWQMV